MNADLEKVLLEHSPAGVQHGYSPEPAVMCRCDITYRSAAGHAQHVAAAIRLENMIQDPEGQRLVDEILARKAQGQADTRPLPGKPRPLPAARPHRKPYSEADYLEAKTRGLDLDEWDDYQVFYELGQ